MTLAFSTRGGGQWRWGGIVWNRGPLVPRPSELGGQSPACPPFLSHGGGFGTWIFGVPTRDPQEEAAPSVPPPPLDCVAGAWWPVLGESPVSSRPAPPILPSSPPPHPACPHPPKTNHQVRQPFILLYCGGWEKGGSSSCGRERWSGSSTLSYWAQPAGFSGLPQSLWEPPPLVSGLWAPVLSVLEAGGSPWGEVTRSLSWESQGLWEHESGKYWHIGTFCGAAPSR